MPNPMWFYKYRHDTERGTAHALRRKLRASGSRARTIWWTWRYELRNRAAALRRKHPAICTEFHRMCKHQRRTVLGGREPRSSRVLQLGVRAGGKRPAPFQPFLGGEDAAPLTSSDEDDEEEEKKAADDAAAAAAGRKRDKRKPPRKSARKSRAQAALDKYGKAAGHGGSTSFFSGFSSLPAPVPSASSLPFALAAAAAAPAAAAVCASAAPSCCLSRPGCWHWL